jgi:xylulokinase
MALRHNIEALESRSGRHIGEITLVGGPAASPLWNQVKADVCQRPVRTVVLQDRSCLGAALTGAMAGGFVPEYRRWVRRRDYSGLKESLSAACAAQRVYDPNPDRAAVYDDLFAKYVTLYPALKGAGVF